MIKRTISALVALPGVILLLWLGGAWTAILVAIVVVMSNLEYARMAKDKGIKHCPIISMGLSLAFVADAYLSGGASSSLILAILLVLALMRPVLAGDPRGALSGTAATVFAAIYLGWSLSHAVLIRSSFEGIAGFSLALSLLGLVWLHDTAALIFGISTGGKHKIAPNISPKKSLEGSIGGMITLAALLAFAYPALESLKLLPQLGWLGRVLLALACSVCCNYGDLGESALKRDDGLKDSGVFLPGHGGFLDRVDSLLLFIPVSYWLLRMLGAI